MRQKRATRILILPLVMLLLAIALPHHHHEGMVCFCPHPTEEDCPDHSDNDGLCVSTESFIVTHLSLDVSPAASSEIVNELFFEESFEESYLSHDTEIRELIGIIHYSSGQRAPPVSA